MTSPVPRILVVDDDRAVRQVLELHLSRPGYDIALASSAEEALVALGDDHDFLLAGNVFTPDVIDTWIDSKTENEVNALKLRPHPYEFMMYYDI